jgi:acetyl esterase/lipase
LLKYLCFYLLVLPVIVVGQDYPRDTSYTIQGSYLKYLNKFPFIEIVNPDTLADINLAKNVVYQTIGNRNLHLDLFSPNRSGIRFKSAIIMIHGGGWVSGDKSHMVPMAVELVKRGYIAVAVEYWLSPEAQYPAAIFDIKTAIRWVKEHADSLQVDLDKIALLGCSSGGQLASLVGFSSGVKKLEGITDKQKFSSDVQAIINMDGVLAFHHPDSQEGRVAGLWLGGLYGEATSQWEEASALSHAGKRDPPTLFIHSQYPRFHAGREDVIKIMNEHGIHTEVKFISNSPHTFWLFHPWFDPTVQYVSSFLTHIFQ